MEAAGKKNAYICESCAKATTTINLVNGVTPFLIACPHCGEPARSCFYKVSQDLVPTHEWFRPSDGQLKSIARASAEFAGLNGRDLLREMRRHRRAGGLELRKIEPGSTLLAKPIYDVPYRPFPGWALTSFERRGCS
jgi:hypothetical protein